MSDLPVFYRVTLPPPIRVLAQNGTVLEQSFDGFVLYELLTHPRWRQRTAISLARSLRDTLLATVQTAEEKQARLDWFVPQAAWMNLVLCAQQAKLHPELGPYQLDFVAAIVEAVEEKPLAPPVVEPPPETTVEPKHVREAAETAPVAVMSDATEAPAQPAAE